MNLQIERFKKLTHFDKKEASGRIPLRPHSSISGFGKIFRQYIIHYFDCKKLSCVFGDKEPYWWLRFRLNWIWLDVQCQYTVLSTTCPQPLFYSD